MSERLHLSRRAPAKEIHLRLVGVRKPNLGDFVINAQNQIMQWKWKADPDDASFPVYESTDKDER